MVLSPTPGFEPGVSIREAILGTMVGRLAPRDGIGVL